MKKIRKIIDVIACLSFLVLGIDTAFNGETFHALVYIGIAMISSQLLKK